MTLAEVGPADLEFTAFQAEALAPIVLVPTLVTGLACLGVVASVFLVRRWRLSQQDQVDRAAEALAPYLVVGDQLSLAVMAAIEDQGEAAVIELLRSSRRQLRGPEAAAITETLESLGEVSRLSRLASSRFQKRRLEGLWGLGEVGGETAAGVLETALDASDPLVRRMAREALALIDDERAVARAMESLLAESEEERSRSRRFLRWVALRHPKVLEDHRVRTDPGSSQRRLLERARRAGTTGLRNPTLTGEFLISFDDPSGELALSVRDGANRCEEDWIDERARRLAGFFLPSTLGTELALGLTLLCATVAGGAIAWFIS